MVQLRDDVVLIDAAVLGPPQIWEASGHLANFTDPLVDCTNCKNRFRLDKLDDPNVCPSCGKTGTFTEPRQFNLMFKTHAGTDRRRRRSRLSAPGDGAGHVRQLQQRAQLDATQATVRHRPGRQELPQRDHPAELDLPNPRVRADGDGVLRSTGRQSEVVRVLVQRADELVSRARRPRRPVAPAGPRCRRAVRTTPAVPPTSSSASRGVGTRPRGSPSAATTTSPSTPTTPARSSTTSTRRPTSATSRT